MDLTNPNNWQVVWQANLRGTLVASYGQPGVGQLQIYDPIPDQQASLATPVGLVRTILPEDEIKPEWNVACKAIVDIELLPTVRNTLVRKWCGINTGTLLELPNLGKFPYRVTLKIPKWIISLRLELWQFTDEAKRYVPLEDSVVWTAVEVVQMRQQELEQLIRQQQQQGDG